MTSFGEKSRECREEKGFSQAELAKQIDAYHSIGRIIHPRPVIMPV